MFGCRTKNLQVGWVQRNSLCLGAGHMGCGRCACSRPPLQRMKMPAATQVVIVDEIGQAKEVAAAKSIAQRGVVMVRVRQPASRPAVPFLLCSSRLLSKRHALVRAIASLDWLRLASHVRSSQWVTVPCASIYLQVGTAHGVSLESLLKNPELNPLVRRFSAGWLGSCHTRTIGSYRHTQAGVTTAELCGDL